MTNKFKILLFSAFFLIFTCFYLYQQVVAGTLKTKDIILTNNVVITNPIKDSFGNIVPSGTGVSVSANNLLLLIDGNVYSTDATGRVQFRVRTRTIK